MRAPLLLLLVFSFCESFAQNNWFESEKFQKAYCSYISDDEIIIGGLKENNPFIFGLDQNLQFEYASDIINVDHAEKPIGIYKLSVDQLLVVLENGTLWVFDPANATQFYPIESYSNIDVDIPIDHTSLSLFHENRLFLIRQRYNNGAKESILNVLEITKDTLNIGNQIFAFHNCEWILDKNFEGEIIEISIEQNELKIWVQKEQNLEYVSLDENFIETEQKLLNINGQLTDVQKRNEGGYYLLLNKVDDQSDILIINDNFDVNQQYEFNHQPSRIAAFSDSLIYTASNFNHSVHFNYHRIQYHEIVFYDDIPQPWLIYEEYGYLTNLEIHDEDVYLIGYTPSSDLAQEISALVLRFGANTITNTLNHEIISKPILYPNPTSDFIYIESDNSIRTITLININGERYSVNGEQNSFNIGHLSPGIYQVLLPDNKVAHNSICIIR